MNSNVRKELEFLFRVLNTDRFKGCLSMPKFYIIEGDVNWQWKVERAETGNGFVISVCEKKLMEDMRASITNMLHVMVHMYCEKEGIKDTCKNGNYHNTLFAVAARSQGLIIEKTQTKYGVITTDIRQCIYDKVMKKCQGRPNLKELVLLNREQQKQKEAEMAENKKIKKYKCPVCGSEATAPGTTHLICGNCNRHMELK